MKMNSDFANKTIKNLQAEVVTLLQAEERDKTYSHAVSETPQIPAYSFSETQAKLAELRGKIAVIRHAINTFNISATLPGYNMTLDEGLGRMSLLHGEKKRLYELLQIPETARERTYGSKEADYVHRNFDVAEVQTAYDNVCTELMKLQQAINIVNLTEEFEIPIE